MNNTAQKDTLFSQPIEQIKDFVFDESVASVFDDMINRSVPDYQAVQEKVTAIALNAFQKNSNIYDLGCSTGNTLVELLQKITDTTVSFIGVDNSSPMLEKCRAKLDTCGFMKRTELLENDIDRIEIQNASVIIMNYTLQFIPKERRHEVLTNMYRGLNPRGVLLITEKIRYADPIFQDFFTKIHFGYKADQGYSELEIAQKRDALERVLIPLTREENIEFMYRAGFQHVSVFFQNYQFASFIAIK